PGRVTAERRAAEGDAAHGRAVHVGIAIIDAVVVVGHAVEEGGVRVAGAGEELQPLAGAVVEVGPLAVAAPGESVAVGGYEQSPHVVLLDEGEDGHGPGAPAAAVGPHPGRQVAVGVVVVVHAQADLFEVVLALDAGAGLADFLHGGQEQADEDGYDRY